MSISPRERRFLSALGVAAILSAAVYFSTSGSSSAPAVVPANDSVDATEKRLARIREVAATVPQKQEVLQAVQAELAKREQGLIQAPTAAQARAQLLQILERLCRAESIPIRGVELGGISPLGDSYGSIDVAVQMECTIEQLVNLLAALGAQPEVISTSSLRITSSNNPKQKVVGARLAVSAVVPRKLVPEKKGAGGV